MSTRRHGSLRLAPLLARVVPLVRTLCLVGLPLVGVRAQHLAWDECDGRSSGGFVGRSDHAGHGGWERAVTLDDGALMATRGNDWRALATPVRHGVVWYAVTLRVQAPIEGYASVVPAAGPGHQVSELGFNSGLGTDEGLWTSSHGVARSGLAATATQTFLQRYDLDAQRWSAWAAAGDGRALLDGDGQVSAAPFVRDSALNTAVIGALYLTKGSAQVLEIHRVALARSAAEALTPIAPGDEPALEAPGDAPAALSPIPTAGVTAFAERAALPPGAVVSYFGDSLTWQGGHIELLRRALADARPDLGVVLHQRGINGGKSTDLVAGVVDLYGSTQAPFTAVLAADRPTAIVVQIGINDAWHGERGNSPAAFEAALDALMSAASAAGVPVLLCTPTLIGERRENPFDAPLDALCEVVRRVAHERQQAPSARVQLCDLRAAFRAELATRNTSDAELGVLTYDGVHLSDDGNALLAHLVGAGLTQLLGEATPPPVPFALVPWPRRLVAGEGALVLAGEVAVAALDPKLAEHAAVLRDALRALVGPTQSPEPNVVVPFTVELRLDTTLPPEHCMLHVADRVVLTGADVEAVARASATLLQLVQRDGDVWRVPRVTVADSPSCTYRGLLVDVARQPHPIAVLEELVTLCWFYKVRYLQLHLTDDQAFTFPSTAFPRLATPGHSYTIDELRDLHDFAAARGVTLIPELDVPGHSGAAIAAMPELFKASDLHHATINFVRPEVIAAVDTLIGELVDVFPSSPYVHVGGDECDLTHVMQEDDFRRAAERAGVTDAHELYRLFLCQLREMVHKRGKRMLVWEGFSSEGRVAIPTDVTVMAFEMLYHTPDKLVAAGYPVINTSWRPLYVVNDRCWGEREIYTWHRGLFRHFVEGFPAFHGMEVPRDKVIGAQMCAWEQPAERELPSLRRRLPAMAERLWNEDAGRPVDEFLARLAATDARVTELLARRK